MIISASRRTDIPAYYSDWFFKRLAEGYVLVRTPMNFHKVSRVSLSPDVVDGFVFWSKNPSAMLPHLKKLNNIPYYFQFTLTSYGKDIEPNVPSKNDFVVPTFQKLSKMIGKERVIWRYDPIIFNEKYTYHYHLEYFKRLSDKLGDFTDTCTISFYNQYKNTEKNTKALGIYSESEEQKLNLLYHFSEIAKNHNFSLQTCAEEFDLSEFNIHHAECIDLEKFKKISGFPLQIEKDKSQRKGCGCAESIDIGFYNTCNHACLYCYANYDRKTVLNHLPKYDSASPFLCSELKENDVVKEKIVHSSCDYQFRIFD